MVDNIAFRAFSSRREASEALASELEQILLGATANGREASLVVSGGTSPTELFHQLRSRKLPWDRVWIIPSDERMVPVGHPDRNEGMIRRELLKDRAAAAGLASLLATGPLPGSLLGHFDAVVLGMGADGHTASLFPDSPDLEAALSSENTLVQLEVPHLGAERISLTPGALLRSDHLFLLFFGAEKRHVFKQALEGDDVRQYPVRVVLQQDRVPLTVFWAP